MQVISPNNVKIYNLSQGKSLPEFLSDAKKRALLKKDVALRRRIELIQDFSMPTVSTKVKVSPDGNYIYAAGTYKPRIKCFDVNQLSLKFERCIDAEGADIIVNHSKLDTILKIAMLLNDRYVELHSQEGRWYRIRMPKFGRDLQYHPANCDLYLVGAGPEIYRLNLSHGQFFKSFMTDAKELNVCELNKDHHLLAVGTIDGKVECWDPRSKQRVGVLDCALNIADLSDDLDSCVCPEITALKFKGALQMAVGTSNGRVLLYDIRTNKPYVNKDHHYDLPIHSIDFNNDNKIVISSDQRCVKLWEENTGAAVTAVEPEHDINHMHIVKDSGLLFLANESSKIQTFFIPMLGPAPKWASFLDSLTEELEENPTQELYDDFKFITAKELASLGLSHLIGSSLLRAYMHGYFMDIRLYHKAKSIANPFAYSEYRKKKIQEKIEESRENRVQIKKLPKVNKNLAEKLMHQSNDLELKSGKKKKQKKEAESLLGDNRFKAMFENPEFQINEESEEFQLINPVIAKKFDKMRKKKAPADEDDVSDKEDSEPEGKGSDEESSDDESTMRWIQHHKKVPKPAKSPKAKEAKMYQLKTDQEFYTMKDLNKVRQDDIKKRRKILKASIEDRIENDDSTSKRPVAKQCAEATFKSRKSENQAKRDKEQKSHREERRKVRRNAMNLPKIKNKPTL